MLEILIAAAAVASAGGYAAPECEVAFERYPWLSALLAGAPVVPTARPHYEAILWVRLQRP